MYAALPLCGNKLKLQEGHQVLFIISGKISLSICQYQKASAEQFYVGAKTRATFLLLRGGKVTSEIRSILGGFRNWEFTSWEMHLGASGRMD